MQPAQRKEVLLDIREDRTNRQLSLTGSIGRGRIHRLDQSLWLMGNTSIGHGKELADRDDLISIYNRLGDSNTIKTFSVRKIKALFLIGIALSTSVSLLLLILLIGT